MKVVNRVKESKDFVKTIKQGKTAKNSSFLIHFCKNQLDHSRVGISVSRKLGNAVTRNRVKRQIRAMIDSLIKFDQYSFDIVIIAKQDFLSKNFADNKSLLSDLLNQVGIVNEEK